MVPCLAEFPESSTHYDWIIHLPQIEDDVSIEEEIS